jgi:GAF domain-containing protein
MTGCMPSSVAKSSDDFDFLLAGMGFVENSRDAKLAISKLVEAAAATLGSDMGSFYLLDKKGDTLEPYVTFNFPKEYLDACSSVRLGEQCCGRAAKYKLPWVVEDMWTDPLFEAAREGAKRAGIRAGFSVPVLDFNGDCLGSLASHFREPFTPTIYQLERQSAFAKLIGFALVKHGVVKPTRKPPVSDGTIPQSLAGD